MRLAVIHAYSKDKGPMDIGHKMSMVLDTRKSNLEDNSGCDFIFGSLRHYYKMRQCNAWSTVKT